MAAAGPGSVRGEEEGEWRASGSTAKRAKARGRWVRPSLLLLHFSASLLPPSPLGCFFTWGRRLYAFLRSVAVSLSSRFSPSYLLPACCSCPQVHLEGKEGCLFWPCVTLARWRPPTFGWLPRVLRSVVFVGCTSSHPPPPFRLRLVSLILPLPLRYYHFFFLVKLLGGLREHLSANLV